MADELNISKTKTLKMDKRFNLKKAMQLNTTIRAKILCVVSWLFKVNILVPDFEWKARERKGKNIVC